MANGIYPLLTDPWVEGGVVHIPHFLTDSNLAAKVGGISANTAMRGSAFFCCSHSHSQGVTTWHPRSQRLLKTFHGGTSDIIHAALIMPAVQLLTIGETMVAPVPKTTQELEDRVAGFVEAIHSPSSTRDQVLTLQPMFLPQEPINRGLGVVGDESPALDRFGGDGSSMWLSR